MTLCQTIERLPLGVRFLGAAAFYLVSMRVLFGAGSERAAIMAAALWLVITVGARATKRCRA